MRYAHRRLWRGHRKGRIDRRRPSECDVDKWGVAVVAENVRIGENVKLAAKEMADEDIPDAE